MEYKGFTYTPAPKTAWDNLSMLEKSEMMKVAVRNGITDLKTIREKYNEFAGGGYLNWKEKASKYKHLDIDNDRTYDYEGWYNENPKRAWDFLNDSPDAHFDDKYKTVYHPTFSTRSGYSGIVDSAYNPQGLIGGTWNKQGSVFTMSPDGYRGPISMDERKRYLENAEDNGVQLREADGSLPVFDDIPWGGVLPNVTVTGNKFAEGGIHIKPENRGKFTALKERTGHSATWFKEHGTPAQKKMATFALNTRHWKHGIGGNLFEEAGQMQIGRPFYSYDWNGQRLTDENGNPILNYNVTLPEVTIIPDSKKSPAQRNEDERYRQRFLRDYAEQQSRDYTTRQSIAAQREWENSLKKKALDLGIAAAQGIGMASDVTSSFFGGIPVYSGLKGAQALDRATQTNELGDYADAALWLSPMLTVAGKKVYDAVKPAAQRVFQKGTPAAEWAKRGQQQPEILNFGNVEDGTFKFTGFVEDPLQMHLKRAQAKGYDTSGISIYDLSKDTPENAAFIEGISKQYGLTPEQTKSFLLSHLSTHGHAAQFAGTKNIIHDNAADNMNAIISHEIDHLLHYPDEPIPDGAYFPRIFKTPNDYFKAHNNTELSARGSQLHDYFGHTGNEPITEDMLEYARHHYVQDTGLDNDMHDFLWTIKDNKKVAEWLTKYATGIVPFGLFSPLMYNQKEK